MSLESLHNYFGITVKSRKNDEKFGFFDFCLSSRNNVGIPKNHNFTPKNRKINFFYHKKKILSDIAKWSFSDLEIEPETPFGSRKFFFLKISLTRIVFWGEIYRELPCRWNHYIIISGIRSKVGKTMKNSVFRLLSVIPKYCWNNSNITVMSSEFHPKKYYANLSFPQKKNSVRHPKMVVFASLRPNLRPLSGIEILFFFEL